LSWREDGHFPLASRDEVGDLGEDSFFFSRLVAGRQSTWAARTAGYKSIRQMGDEWESRRDL
jgi:hypothetical protein